MQPDIFTTVEPSDIRNDDTIRITQTGPDHSIVVNGKVKWATVGDSFRYVELYSGGAWSLEPGEGLSVTVERKVVLPLINGAVILVKGEPYIYRTRRAEQGTNPWEGPQSFISSYEAAESDFITLHTPTQEA